MHNGQQQKEAKGPPIYVKYFESKLKKIWSQKLALKSFFFFQKIKILHMNLQIFPLLYVSEVWIYRTVPAYNKPRRRRLEQLDWDTLSPQCHWSWRHGNKGTGRCIVQNHQSFYRRVSKELRKQPCLLKISSGKKKWINTTLDN